MTWKRIVVGVDGSPASLRAVEQAARIADAARALLLPVHAVPALPTMTGIGGIEPMPGYSPELQDELLRASRAEIERALNAIAPARRVEVRTGPAPYIIAEEARERRANLVVLGGKHHGVLARTLGHSTAHHLTRTLDVPMLIVGDGTGSIARVLVAVDLSRASLPAIRAARQLAQLCGARLRLLHVVEPFRFSDLAPDSWDDQAYRQQSENAFEKVAATEDRVVRYGDPTAQIVEEAAAWHADVVVVGSHGKGWVDRILVGSTTQQLVAALPTSLLVVPVKQPRGARLALSRR